MGFGREFRHRLAHRAVVVLRRSWAWSRAKVQLPWYRRLARPVPDITVFQRPIPIWARHRYSQNGEDGVLDAIFAIIGTTNRYLVEFGAADGSECNSRHLIEHRGWAGLRMDGREPAPRSDIRQAFVTAENIEELFDRFGVPEHFDLLSIDIDGNDYWVWKAIERHRPRVVVIEYNAGRPPRPAVTVPYDAAFVWDQTDWFGASLGALSDLGWAKGYRLIAADRSGVNAFFVDDALAGRFAARSLEAIYRPPAYGFPGMGHPADPLGRPWVDV